ncbi:MAG: 3'-5' exonuclease [Agarilytica sp.]
MLSKLKYQLKKSRWKQTARKGVFSDLYESSFPTTSSSISESSFLAVDCEMTGLNPAKDSLLSIGWIEISAKKVILGKSNHMLIYSESGVSNSAKIHGLHDSRVAGAASVGKVLSIFIRDALNKIIIFHHAPLDIAFLQKAALETVGCPLLFTYLDTLEIEQKRLSMQNRRDSLQLNLCRERYNLPPLTEHNALSDARATAELFLAQCENLSPKNDLKISDLALHSA